MRKASKPNVKTFCGVCPNTESKQWSILITTAQQWKGANCWHGQSWRSCSTIQGWKAVWCALVFTRSLSSGKCTGSYEPCDCPRLTGWLATEGRCRSVLLLFWKGFAYCLYLLIFRDLSAYRCKYCSHDYSVTNSKAILQAENSNRLPWHSLGRKGSATVCC